MSELFQVNIWSDTEKVCLDFKYIKDKYLIVSTSNSENFSLALWEGAGESIQFRLYSRVNGNTIASRKLLDFKCEQIESKRFIRPGGETLCILSNNGYNNIKIIERTILKLLKDGFGI